MGITASQVKELREKTGVGMMDCKKALAETDGDMEQAIDWLRKKGLAKAAQRAERAAENGLIVIKEMGEELGLFELSCETDFVAKNDEFRALVANLSEMAFSRRPADIDAFNALPYAGDTSKTVGDAMAEILAKIGENISIGRYFVDKPAVAPGKLFYYIHTGSTLAVVLDVSAGKAESLETEIVQELAHDICLHIAAMAPLYLNEEAIPTEVVEKEKTIYMEEAKASGKPENILEKIALGKLGRFYKDNALVKQDFVKDNEKTIESLVAEKAKELGDTLTLQGFKRIKIGQK